MTNRYIDEKYAAFLALESEKTHSTRYIAETIGISRRNVQTWQAELKQYKHVFVMEIDQSIRIASDVIVRIKRPRIIGNVTIGIEAPKHIAIHREEIYRKIQSERQSD